MSRTYVETLTFVIAPLKGRYVGIRWYLVASLCRNALFSVLLVCNQLENHP